MKRGNWVAIDKRFINLLPKDNRPFTELEAMFSYSVNRDDGLRGSINGYAARWGWSRDKTRRFIRDIESGGDYYPTGKKTGSHTGKKQAIRYVFNKLESKQNRGKNREVYNQHDTIIEPYDPLSFNPKTKKGIFQKNEKSLPPISFQNFIKEKKQTLLDKKEQLECIAYFLDRYKIHWGDQHPYLRPEQWQDAIDDIFAVNLEHDDFYDLDAEECRTLIDAYFTKQYQAGCDYRLMHFLSAGVKKVLYYENLH